MMTKTTVTQMQLIASLVRMPTQDSRQYTDPDTVPVNTPSAHRHLAV